MRPLVFQTPLINWIRNRIWTEKKRKSKAPNDGSIEDVRGCIQLSFKIKYLGNQSPQLWNNPNINLPNSTLKTIDTRSSNVNKQASK